LFNLTKDLSDLRVEIFDQMVEITDKSGLDFIFSYLVAPERVVEEHLISADRKLRYLEVAFKIALKSGRYA
jgi:hypothetical protein